MLCPKCPGISEGLDTFQWQGEAALCWSYQSYNWKFCKGAVNPACVTKPLTTFASCIQREKSDVLSGNALNRITNQNTNNEYSISYKPGSLVVITEALDDMSSVSPSIPVMNTARIGCNNEKVHVFQWCFSLFTDRKLQNGIFGTV